MVSSVKLTTELLQMFLATDIPEVVCVRGKWGVGKTFIWGRTLEGQVRAKGVTLNRYSYISLFGVGSLDQLNEIIFENSTFLVDPKAGKSGKAKKLGAEALRELQKNVGFAEGLPFIGDVVKTLTGDVGSPNVHRSNQK